MLGILPLLLCVALLSTAVGIYNVMLVEVRAWGMQHRSRGAPLADVHVLPPRPLADAHLLPPTAPLAGARLLPPRPPLIATPLAHDLAEHDPNVLRLHHVCADTDAGVSRQRELRALGRCAQGDRAADINGAQPGARGEQLQPPAGQCKPARPGPVQPDLVPSHAGGDNAPTP